MPTQPQLLQIALDKKDVVYTPDWVARDMVDFFKPTGRILEPAAGDGAILKYLPGADWCEIEQGVDFFQCVSRYDWVVTNPPFKSIDEFLDHSYKISDNILFLIPPQIYYRAGCRMLKCRKYGGIKHMRYYGMGGALGFPMGNAITAMHFQRGYTGPMYTSFYNPLDTAGEIG